MAMYQEPEKRREPLRPPMLRPDNLRPQRAETDFNQAPTVQYQDPNTKQVINVVHPEIIGDQAQSKQLIRPAERVPVKVGATNMDLAFQDYLRMLGVGYDRYAKVMQQPNVNPGEVWQMLHKTSLNTRAEQAVKITRDIEQRPGEFEKSQRGRKEVEGFFAKVVTDSGYAKAWEAPPQNDYEEKIDVFVAIDPKTAYRGEGEPVYFGVQHMMTANRYHQEAEFQARQKHDTIDKRPQTFIPEHPEYGTVMRVVIVDDRSKYFAENTNHSYDANLKMLERKTESPHKAWEAFLYDGAGKRNNLTEQQARSEEIQRTYELMTELYASCADYSLQVSYYQTKDLEHKKEVLRNVLKKMRDENPELK